jgi:tetratricopeptide (TPR) repeat protein
MREALYFYENQDYEKASLLFQQILNSRPDMMASHLYSGIAFLELKKYPQAEQSFNTVIAQNDNLYIERAEWYLGMIYLLNGETDKARMQFQKIKQSDGYFRDEAAKILRKIRRVK